MVLALNSLAGQCEQVVVDSSGDVQASLHGQASIAFLMCLNECIVLQTCESPSDPSPQYTRRLDRLSGVNRELANSLPMDSPDKLSDKLVECQPQAEIGLKDAHR